MATDVPSFVVQQPLLVQESYRNELKETLRARAFWARPVVLKLKRPVVARIATLPERPLILIDLHPEEGVIGRSYLEPYIRELIGYLILALYDLGEMFKRRRLAPIEFSKSRPQVATLRWLRRHVDDRCCRPRYGGPGRTGEGGWCASLCAAGTQHRPCVGAQQQWPPAEIPTELESEAVELREDGGFNGVQSPAAMGESRRPPRSGNPSCTARRTVAATSEGKSRAPQSVVPSKPRMVSISLSYWRQQAGSTIFRAR